MFRKYLELSDLFLLRLFNRSIKCKPLDIIMPAITYLGSFSFTIGLCLLALLNSHQYIQRIGIRCSITLTLATLISQIIKVNVSRIRPFLKIQNLNIKKIGIDKYSFPSGHTTAAFSISITISLLFPSISLLCIGLALLVGVSRIYLGVHYPTDVVAGIVLGSLCSYMVYFLL